MTSKKALITRPQHDKVTDYFAWWSLEILEYARSRGVDIIDLGDEAVTREGFQNYLIKQNPRLVIVNGHGDDSVFAGHGNEPLVVCGENEDILKNKIVYVRACNCASLLGPAAIKAGAISFIGYDLPFCFLTNKNKSCTPDEDELANIFKTPSNIIPTALLKGNTVKEADDKSKNKFRELIRYYGASNVDPDAKDIRRWLFWNMRAQKVLGDLGATF